MTQEDKKLLLVDLCSRLPYGVKVQHQHQNYLEEVQTVEHISRKYGEIETNSVLGFADDFKPYLKPLYSEKIKNRLIKLIKMSSEVGGFALHKWEADELLAWLEKQGKETSEKEFTFKALPRLLEMIEVSDRAKAYTEKLAVALDNEGYHTDAKIVRESIKIMNGEEVSMATMDEQKPVDNIEPKFKVGNWIVWQNKCYKVNYNGCGYELIDQNGLSTSLEYGTVDKSAHLWTIQDAKDGDVLATPNYIYIFNSIDKETETVAFYCLIKKSDKHFSFGDYRIHDEILNSTPATKKQYDILIKAMTDSGYTFNFEKKELKKIKQKSQRMVSAEAKEALYDKPTDEEMKELLRTEYEKGRADTIAEMKSSWSEEDEKFFKTALWHISYSISNGESTDIHCDTTEWLKSLKDRVQPRPKQEWSEKDEKILNNLIDYIKVDDALQYSEKQVVNWLKSLRPQNTWKPSDEQLNNILDVLSFDNCTPKRRELLESLYEQLKKL